jgi:hypothetical protein
MSRKKGSFIARLASLATILTVSAFLAVGCGGGDDKPTTPSGGGGGGGPGKLTINGLPSNITVTVYIYDYSGTISNRQELNAATRDANYVGGGGSGGVSGINTFDLYDGGSAFIYPTLTRSGTFAVITMWNYNQNVRCFQQVRFTNGGATINWNNASFVVP